MLIDFIPARLGDCVFFGNHQVWMQVACEGKTFVEDQGDTIV